MRYIIKVIWEVFLRKVWFILVRVGVGGFGKGIGNLVFN